jgi:amino acid adenylation domain-containing protein
MILYLPGSNVGCCTLVELLRFRALRQPEQIAYLFLRDDEVDTPSITYRELDQRARAIATFLQHSGLTGERVLLLHAPGLDYIATFFGCLYAGAIAVPAYPPKLNRSLPRLQAIVADAQATTALTTARILSRVQPRLQDTPQLQGLRWLIADTIPSSMAENWQEPTIGSDTLAFLQYTSGSTASPKGVMLSHANLLHNCSMLYDRYEYGEKSWMVSWTPPFHDMGLILGILQPLFGGFPATLMSPFTFAQEPVRWLETISTYKATTTCAPNFAFDLCVDKVTPAQLSSLDLSNLQVAVNAAEPIRAETLERFATTFAPCGFRREAFNPGYGLAEATLGVTVSKKSANPLIYSVQKAALEHDRVVPADPLEKGTQNLVGCGQGFSNQKIVIVNPATCRLCSPDQVGEIWVAGPHVTKGYWGRAEDTEEVFQAHIADTGEGPFLRTGDLGFLANGELFVTGRLKDLIIIHGRNHYPQDIEQTVEKSHSALREGCCAAFSVEAMNEEQLVVVQEVDRQFHDPDSEGIAQAMRQEVIQEHGIQIYAVVLIRHGSIPRTSSGKIQRHACSMAFLNNTLSLVGTSILVAPKAQEEGLTLTLTELLEAEPQEQRGLLTSYLREEVAHLLGIESSKIDLHTSLSFFGFDSLRGLELKSEIEEKFGVVLPAGYFPIGPNITKVATDVLAQLALSEAKSTEVVLAPSENYLSESPLSFGQKALWFLHQLAPDSAAYNFIFTARILSDVDVAALHRSFQRLVDRHAAWRTAFATRDGEPQQIINERADVYFRTEDASTWDELTFREHVRAESHIPFKLDQAPLCRITLYIRSPREYLLLIVQHHIIADLWSLDILLSELNVLYPAQRLSQQVSLPPLPLQYTDYVQWQQKMLVSPEGQQLWTYWQRQLSGVSPVLNLPLDRPRPPVQTYNGTSYPFTIGTDLTQRLKALARAESASMYVCLLGAFEILLHRYTGQTDFLVGSPTAGRSRAKLGDVVGYFVNPVALRATFSSDHTFRTFLTQVKQNVAGALDHQDFPFALLVERLEQERDPSRAPLFQVLFVFQKEHLPNREALNAFAVPMPGTQMQVGGLVFESTIREQHTSRVDLTLTMAEVGDELAASLEYNSDLFSTSTIKNFVECFRTLLEGIVTHPEQRVSELPLLSAAMLQQLQLWNATQAQYPHACIHEIFEDQVRLTPENRAMSFLDQHLSYSELNRRANQLAHYLQQLGVGPEVRVGLCLERSLDTIVAILAILKAGGAYVPLDQSYPKERLAFMVKDARMNLLLTQSQLQEALPPVETRIVFLESAWSQIAQQSAENLADVAVTPDNLAYVMYTSGSTGIPKGVGIPHRAVVRLVKGSNYIHLDEREVLLQFAPISFDASTLEIWGSLLNGARLVVFPPHVPSLTELSSTLEQERITTLWLTSGLFLQMAEDHLPVLKKVRQLLAGGDVLSTSHVQSLLQAEPSTCLINGYGPTENTTFTCCYPMLSPEQIGRTVPIGRPIANTRVYVCDKHLQLVPVGVAGELYAAGDGLARGYLNSPDLTAEKFIPNPFGGEPGERLYRTGDLVRYLPDGNLEFLGRLDQQVKVRGFRVEPGEIEAVLSQHPLIQESMVIARDDRPTEKHLVAYVVPGSGHSLAATDLRRYLQAQLPDYMLPSSFVLLESLPLTPNGKVDRKALPLPERDQSEQAYAFVAPRTAVEESLAGLWAEVLQQERVGISDNFFLMGGHSLLATQIISRVRRTLQVEIPLQSLFEAPTVAEFAEKVTQAQVVKSTDSPIATIQKRKKQNTAEYISALSDAEVDALLQSQVATSSHSGEVKE